MGIPDGVVSGAACTLGQRQRPASARRRSTSANPCRILGRIVRMQSGNPGDVAPVGQGIGEMRIHHGAGYR